MTEISKSLPDTYQRTPSDDWSTSWGDVDEITLDVRPETVKPDPLQGRSIAVLIASKVLGADIWFAFDDSEKP